MRTLLLCFAAVFAICALLTLSVVEGFPHPPPPPPCPTATRSSSSSRHFPVPTGPTLFDVTLYGAVGDGVTDDTDAVFAANQALLQSLVSCTSSAELYFPPGFFLLNSAPKTAEEGGCAGAFDRPAFICLTPTTSALGGISLYISGGNTNVSTILYNSTLGHLFHASSTASIAPYQDFFASFADFSVQEFGGVSLYAHPNTPNNVIDIGSGVQVSRIERIDYESKTGSRWRIGATMISFTDEPDQVSTIDQIQMDGDVTFFTVGALAASEQKQHHTRAHAGKKHQVHRHSRNIRHNAKQVADASTNNLPNITMSQLTLSAAAGLNNDGWGCLLSTPINLVLTQSTMTGFHAAGVGMMSYGTSYVNISQVTFSGMSQAVDSSDNSVLFIDECQFINGSSVIVTSNWPPPVTNTYMTITNSEFQLALAGIGVVQSGCFVTLINNTFVDGTIAVIYERLTGNSTQSITIETCEFISQTENAIQAYGPSIIIENNMCQNTVNTTSPAAAAVYGCFPDVGPCVYEGNSGCGNGTAPNSK